MGFNGATLSRTWKLERDLEGETGLRVLQWSHAQSNVETRQIGNNLGQRIGLQWSHAQSNVETWKGRRDRPASRISASMEPRSVERGNSAQSKPNKDMHLARKMRVVANSSAHAIRFFSSNSRFRKSTELNVI